MNVLPKGDWVVRFAARLHELRGRGTPDVIAIAFAVYGEANDLSPEEAAESYAAAGQPGDPGAPGN